MFNKASPALLLDISRTGGVMIPRRFLRRKAASIYLHETYGVDRAPSTLAKLAVIGGGPPFRRINRIPLYATADLDLWVESKLTAPMRSTSEVAEPRLSRSTPA
jgi:hypothetical protein